jgi:hypothetical protein
VWLQPTDEDVEFWMEEMDTDRRCEVIRTPVLVNHGPQLPRLRLRAPMNEPPYNGESWLSSTFLVSPTACLHFAKGPCLMNTV